MKNGLLLFPSCVGVSQLPRPILGKLMSSMFCVKLLKCASLSLVTRGQYDNRSDHESGGEVR